MNKTRKRSLVLTGALLILGLVLCLAVHLTRQSAPKADQVEITVGGEVFGRYDLNADRDVSVLDLCVVRIAGGEAFVLSSNCQNRDCVRHRPVSVAGESIICLPNQVVVRVTGADELDLVL